MRIEFKPFNTVRQLVAELDKIPEDLRDLTFQDEQELYHVNSGQDTERFVIEDPGLFDL